MTSLARKLKRGGNRRPVRGGAAIRPRAKAP